MTQDSLYVLLSLLWLHEPDEETLAQVRALGAITAPLHTDADPATLCAAYADLFLLNVYPYGTAYTDEWGELNTPAALRVAEQYATHGYASPELSAVGAPDHLGLCLGFVAHLTPFPPLLTQQFASGEGERGGEAKFFLHSLLTWAPVCCFAAERDPSAHPFYRALAQFTRELLLAAIRLPLADGKSQIATPSIAGRTVRNLHFAIPSGAGRTVSEQPDNEIRLRDVVRFLLAPARCGLFLSRARLGLTAKALGMRLPFGSRFEVCEWLFASAGQGERIHELLGALRAEADVWAAAYHAWVAQWPAWQPVAAQWLARLAATQQMLDEMARLASAGVAVEYADFAADEMLQHETSEV